MLRNYLLGGQVGMFFSFDASQVAIDIQGHTWIWMKLHLLNLFVDFVVNQTASQAQWEQNAKKDLLAIHCDREIQRYSSMKTQIKCIH